jgi:Xaa-Pro dipeptidase
MIRLPIPRRRFLGGAAAFAAAAVLPFDRVAAQAAAELPKIALPPPISGAERVRRLARARDLMRRDGIGAVLVESGPSLDYYTGIQWWRSERLTGVVIPAEGEPIVVTPFFERPTIEEMLAVPAEIRTWEEDEEPLKLVADFLKERKVAGQPIAFEETNRFFLEDRLRRQLPSASIVNANPVVRAQRMIKSPAELALMQSAADIMIAALRYAGERTREGMTLADIDAMTASGAAHSGMVAKLAACRAAVVAGVPSVAIVSGRGAADYAAATGTTIASGTESSVAGAEAAAQRQ